MRVVVVKNLGLIVRGVDWPDVVCRWSPWVEVYRAETLAHVEKILDDLEAKLLVKVLAL